MNKQIDNKGATDWATLPDEFMTDVQCSKAHKSSDMPGDGDDDEIDQKLDEVSSGVAKGGEGSRGGNVIGHTTSGKPIYMTNSKMTADVASDHFSYTAADHADANRFHEDKAREMTKEGNKAKAAEHQDQATAHWRLENHKKQNTGPTSTKKPPTRFLGAGLRGEFARSQEEVDMMKGGEGSRGGNVIGHTKSGKAIYGDQHPRYAEGPEKYADFTAADHEDAEAAHEAAAKKLHKKAYPISDEDSREAKHHREYAGAHGYAAMRAKTPDYKPEWGPGSESSAARKPPRIGGDSNASVEDGGNRVSQEAKDAKYPNLRRSLELLTLLKGGEGSRGGNVIGHTSSGKPVYEKHGGWDASYSDFSKKDHRDAAKIHEQKYQESADSVRRASNPDAKFQAQESRRSHRTAMNSHHTEADHMPANPEFDPSLKSLRAVVDLFKNHHGPNSGGSSVFGTNAGAGFSSGAAAGNAIGSESGSGSVSPPSAIAHTAMGKIGAALTPKPKPAGGSGGGANHGTSGSMGIGATAKSCEKCGTPDCKEHMDKALTSRALAIPVYMRQAAYDPDGTFRSATTQTSRMYSAIAPDVQQTLDHVAQETDLRSRAAVADLRRSQEIQEMRQRLNVSVRPRGDTRFGG